MTNVVAYQAAREDYVAREKKAGKFVLYNGEFVYQPNSGDMFNAHQLRWISMEVDRLNRDNKILNNNFNQGKDK
jgi:hypothetical protein